MVIDALDAHGCNPRGNPERQTEALCPAHEDRNPSLGVKEAADGTALVFCQAGCSTEEVMAALGLEMTDLFPSTNGNGNGNGHVALEEVATYPYVDEAGVLLYEVVRFEPKTFRQRRPAPGGGWEWKLGDIRRVLYRLPDVLKAKARNEWIIVCEGEKDVHAVERKGWTATTLPGGAGKWRREYTEILTGCRVLIVADDDEPGRKHAIDVWRQLQGHAGVVAARLPAVPHKDVADHLRAGLGLSGAHLRPLPDLEELPQNGSSGAAVFMTAKAFCSRPAPDKALRVVGPGFQRGLRTTIGALTGEGKTTLGCQVVSALIRSEPFLDTSDPAWRGCGGRALVVDVEQGEETVKERFREAGLDTEESVDLLWKPAGFAFDQDSEDIALVERTLKDGRYDLVLFDPLYQLHRGDQNSERTAADVMRIIDGWAEKYKFAVVIPMHARKPHPQAGANQFSINDISGNGTWVRNAEIVFGLQLMSPGFSKLHFWKDRLGGLPAIRTYWGLGFDTDTRMFARNFAEKESKQAAWKRIKPFLADEDGRSLESLADELGVSESTTKDALKKVGASENDAGLWRLEPWPVAQGALLADQPAG